MSDKIYAVMAVRSNSLHNLDLLTLHATFEGARRTASARNPLTWASMDDAGRMSVGYLPDGNPLRVIEEHRLEP